MEIILLEKIFKMGDVGDQIRVKPGYGRNFLIPSGKAVLATAENIAKFEARRAELEKQQRETLLSAEARAEKLNTVNVDIQRKAGPQGKLFSSVGPGAVAEAVTGAGVELARNEVQMPDGPIRNIGEYELNVRLHADVSTVVRINVVAEESNV